MPEIKKNYFAFYPITRPGKDGDNERPMTMRIKVKVKVERRNFGRSDLLITPVTGDGEIWVSKDSVEDEDGTPMSEIKPTDRDDEDDDS